MDNWIFPWKTLFLLGFGYFGYAKTILLLLSVSNYIDIWCSLTIIISVNLYHNNFIAAFNGAGKARGASRGSGARHAPY